MKSIKRKKKHLWNRNHALKFLQKSYDEWQEIHSKNAPTNNTIPVGGGEWMDTFFKLEGIRGMQTSLRNGDSISKALEVGKTTSEIAVKIWNRHREYQVHRCQETCHSFLERLVVFLLNDWEAKRNGKRIMRFYKYCILLILVCGCSTNINNSDNTVDKYDASQASEYFIKQFVPDPERIDFFFSPWAIYDDKEKPDTYWVFSKLTIMDKKGLSQILDYDVKLKKRGTGWVFIYASLDGRQVYPPHKNKTNLKMPYYK